MKLKGSNTYFNTLIHEYCKIDGLKQKTTLLVILLIYNYVILQCHGRLTFHVQFCFKIMNNNTNQRMKSARQTCRIEYLQFRRLLQI